MMHDAGRIRVILALVSAGSAAVARADIHIEQIGRYETGIYDGTAAEIPAYDAASRRVFVTNSADHTIDIIDVSDPTNPTLVAQVDVTPWGASPNGVAARGGIIAAAVQTEPKTEPGSVILMNADGAVLSVVVVGALPDMVTFTPDGTTVISANEGEPNDDYSIDPIGTISIIDVTGGAEHVTQDDVTTLDFSAFNDAELPGVRIFGPGASVAQDIEPEYVAVTADSTTAYVTLQENNALAIVDVPGRRITDVVALGTIHHNKKRYAMDCSDRDGGIVIKRRPVRGLFLPDAIASYTVGDGKTYAVTANEGDARDYETFAEEERIGDLLLDPEAFPDAAFLQQDSELGRLNVTTTMGDVDNDGAYEELYSFGTRSFSIWNRRGKRKFDSGADFERITAAAFPADFNSNNAENDSFDSRSDNKGPEPEALAIGEVDGRVYAFIGLERIGGILVYDITDPKEVRFIEYVNPRDFSGDAEDGTAGDLGPEGIVFVPASDSPIAAPLLIIAHEVSGSTAIFRVDSARP